MNISSQPIETKKHWFWGILQQYLPIYRDVGLASTIINILTLASPLFVMNVYDRVVPNKAMETLWVLASGVTLAYVIDFFLRVLRARFVDLAGQHADIILADQLMYKVLHIRLDTAPKSTGGFVNTVREFEQLREFFSSTSLLACIDLPFTCLFFIIIGYIGGPMVLVPLIALPCMIGFSLLLQIPFKRATETQYKQNTQKNALLVEIIGGLEAIKVNELYFFMRQRWLEVVTNAAQTQAKTRALATTAANSTIFVTATLNTVFVIWGVYRIADTSLTMGGLIACVILLGRVMQPIMQLSSIYGQLHKSLTALNVLNNLMSLPTENTSTPTQSNKIIDLENSELQADSNQHILDDHTLQQITLSSQLVESSYQLENVEFHYSTPQMKRPGQQAVQPLLALNIPKLHIKAGEKVGIIGQTGSGKSTLARLLVGLYSPAQGVVRLGHRDLACADLTILRQRIGFMPQDNYLFQGSLYENIRMSAPEASPETIQAAAQLAGLMPFIERHPEGFALPVGERGQALSGGQRQAIALARVLVRDPDIIILDEPTSNLDLQSEQELIKHCQIAFAQKTLIICTHRLSILSLVERIIVLHEGKIKVDGKAQAVLQALSSTGV